MTATTEAVYSAENLLGSILDRQGECPTIEVVGSTLTLPIERKFADLPSMQAYVDRVLALPWVRGKYPQAQGHVTVRERRGATLATYAHNTIAIPPLRIGGKWAMRELVLLHEVSHHLAPGDGHGLTFQATFTELVEGCVGPEAALLLRVFITENGKT